MTTVDPNPMTNPMGGWQTGGIPQGAGIQDDFGLDTMFPTPGGPSNAPQNFPTAQNFPQYPQGMMPWYPQNFVPAYGMGFPPMYGMPWYPQPYPGYYPGASVPVGGGPVQTTANPQQTNPSNPTTNTNTSAKTLNDLEFQDLSDSTPATPQKAPEADLDDLLDPKESLEPMDGEDLTLTLPSEYQKEVQEEIKEPEPEPEVQDPLASLQILSPAALSWNAFQKPSTSNPDSESSDISEEKAETIEDHPHEEVIVEWTDEWADESTSTTLSETEITTEIPVTESENMINESEPWALQDTKSDRETLPETEENVPITKIADTTLETPEIVDTSEQEVSTLVGWLDTDIFSDPENLPEEFQVSDPMPSHFDPQTKLIANDLQLENELPTVEEAIASVAETAPSPGLGEEMSALGALLDDTPLIDIKT